MSGDVDESVVMGLIPARGGSKSIPLKNLAPIDGVPMIGYVIAAGRATPCINHLVCSTDHKGITDQCLRRGAEVITRPAELGLDDTPVTAVILHALQWMRSHHGLIPGLVALLQPTSPFVLPEHVTRCVDVLRAHPDADSAQTITPVAHSAHAYNQRVFEEGRVRFRFAEERKTAYNKQRKPAHYVFGNLVVTRSRSLLAGADCFGDLSMGVPIDARHALDVDTAADLDFADYLVRTGKVPRPVA